jgi:outer membrane protein assembly factor BamB
VKPAALLIASTALVAAACSRTSISRASSAPTFGPASGSPAGAAPADVPGVSRGPWSEGQHDSTHSNTSSARGPANGTHRWTVSLGAPVIDGPAIGPDGTIYQTTDDGVLHAISLATGTVDWTLSDGAAISDPDLSITPVVPPDGIILWPAAGDELDAVSPTGKLLWQTKFAGRTLSPTVAPDGEVIATDGSGSIEALRPTAAGPNVAWSTKVGTVSYSSPAVAPDGTIYTTAGNELVAINASSGKPIVKWRFKVGAAIEVSPTVAPGGTVILGTDDAYEYGITVSGTVAWRYRRTVFSYSSPAVTSDGLAYFGDNNGNVDVVNAAHGTVVGRYAALTKPLSPNGVGVWTAPVVDTHHDVYFGTASGHIVGFAYNGTQLFDIATGATVSAYPALASDGTLVIGSSNGTLYALKS